MTQITYDENWNRIIFPGWDDDWDHLTKLNWFAAQVAHDTHTPVEVVESLRNQSEADEYYDMLRGDNHIYDIIVNKHTRMSVIGYVNAVQFLYGVYLGILATHSLCAPTMSPQTSTECTAMG